MERLRADAMSRQQAADELDIGYATLLRLLEEHAADLIPHEGH